MNFAPLTPLDFARYRSFFVNQPHELCSYSLSSIIAWSNDEYQPWGAEYQEAFVVAAEFETTRQNRHLLLPVSRGRMFAPEALARLAHEANHTQYWFVPAAYVEHFGRSSVDAYFHVEGQPAYDDYIYRVSDLAELKGNRYAKKRNLIKQFRRKYVDAGRVAIEVIAADNIAACLDFLEAWCLERDCDADDQVDLSCEKQAAINTLNHLAALEVRGILLRVDGQVNAFGISAPLTRNMATLQYEKAYGNVKGLYQFFDNTCAHMLFDGYTYLNKESDMGIPGLAKAKRSYHPARMVRSVKLILRA